jgi:tetratricopeptide (TPR) repeat protein
MKPESARIFNIIGALYAENIGNYDLAIEYHEKALNIQEMVI